MSWGGGQFDSPGVQPAHAHARSDRALGTEFKLLKMVSVGGGDCLGGVVTHLGSLGHVHQEKPFRQKCHLSDTLGS